MITKGRHTIKREKQKGRYYYIERDNTGKITSKTRWSSNAIKRSKAQNKIKYSRETRYFRNKAKKNTIEQTTKEDAYAILKANLKRTEEAEKVTEYKQMIDKEKTIHIGRVNIQRKGIIDRQKANRIYKKILMEKIKDGPKKLEKIQKIINGKDRLLRNRFVATIELYTNKGLIGIINVGGILIERDIDAYNYWKGRTIDSNEFEIHAEEFRKIIGNPKIYTAKPTSQKAGKVTEVKTEWSFA